MWAGVIRARTGDLFGALAVLQEAIAQSHADGTRLLLASLPAETVAPAPESPPGRARPSRRE
jgi:hypothetical protein